MDTIRTEDQRKADELLEQAIAACLSAYGITEDDELIADFAVIIATNKLYPDGVVQTKYPILMPGADIPWYRVLGLIETHRTVCKIRMSSGNDNG
jgi:hypothetical protein